MQNQSALDSRIPSPEVLGPRLKGYWRGLALGIWLLFFLVCLYSSILSIRWTDQLNRTPARALALVDRSIELEAILHTLQPLQQAIQEAGLSLAAYAHYLTFLRVVTAIPFYLLGILIIRSRSDRLMAVLFAMTMCFIGASGTFFNPLWKSIPSWYPWPLFLNRLFTALQIAPLLILFTFPDGRFVPRWTVHTLWIILPFTIAVSFTPEGSLLNPWNWTGPASVLPVIIFSSFYLWGAYALAYRYRQDASLAQKQQIKWFVFGAGLILINSVIDFSASEIYPILTGEKLIQTARQAVQFGLFQDSAWYLSEILLAACIATSLFRYRLWDVDLVIRRTLSYAVISAALVASYLLAVVSLQTVFSGITGNADSPLITVLSTLAIAALFNPLRTRVQSFIDRRFYRTQYDAEQSLAHFAAWTRDEIDLESLSVGVLGLVDETLQPEQVSLWIRNTGNSTS